MNVVRKQVLIRSLSSHPCSLQDSLRQKEERIEELEEALRESVQITAEREVVLAQEEHARSHAEKQVKCVRWTPAVMHELVSPEW